MEAKEEMKEEVKEEVKEEAKEEVKQPVVVSTIPDEVNTVEDIYDFDSMSGIEQHLRCFHGDRHNLRCENHTDGESKWSRL